MSIDLSLDRVLQLFSLLPAYTRPTIHVAGTNGKGSVTAILSSIFTSSHIAVGRFNSPHLIEVWDSVTINGDPVPEDTYLSARACVLRADHANAIKSTNFEILTATAALIFEQERVNVAIFEVGLGGKLDATNALPDRAILVSAITSVDLDHQQFLGNTPADIARVKAGIARSGKSCVLGFQRHPEVEPAIEDVVKTVRSSIVKAIEVTSHDPAGVSAPATHRYSQSVSAHFAPWNTTLELQLPLLGQHQLENLATALTIISVLITHRSDSGIEAVIDRITPSTLGEGVLNTKWPGRLQYLKLLDPPLTLLVDGAHNRASAAALQSYLTSLDDARSADLPSRTRRTFVLGLSHSPPKTPLDTLAPLLRPGDRVALVRFSDVQDMPWVSNAPFPDAERAARSLVADGEVHLFARDDDLEDGPLEPLRRALRWAEVAAEGDVAVLAGSLYLVADLYRIAREQGIYPT